MSVLPIAQLPSAMYTPVILLVIAYSALSILAGRARSNESDPMWMNRPPPSSRMPGRAACISSVGLLTKNSSISRQFRHVSSSMGINGCGPVALMTRISIRPNCFCT